MNMLRINERGLTLVEVLLTIVITSIVSTVIYSTFITGLKLYQKIQVEGQLRDDADYIAATILNQMYSNAPKRVESFVSPSGDRGIRLVKAVDKEVNGYLVEDEAGSEEFIDIYVNSGSLIIDQTLQTPEFENDITLSDLKSQLAVINENEHDEQTSEILLDPSVGSCTVNDAGASVCKHGTIKLTLVLADRQSTAGSLIKTDPLVLESSFGF
ncbi:hypothetical protein CVD28_14540 [Bacillus sp. M6-12]|uniref:PulJ/GspJ family protein n=1 Tax=Bacillus sp. M6-12 TaxID=2054166 RepID=UPI000C771E64|nr:prepilin-type N-terminal cleavage/methylation domain-containing protein [Bacillus sp. M6-12]PLS16871.1 hypothetical protein CVD28_14540 [Bacillus sp. M6-12]